MNNIMPTTSGLDLRLAESSSDVLKVMVVRGIVFIEEQGVSWEGEIDEYEDSCVHVLGEAGGQPVAAGRLRFMDDGRCKIERVAVRPAWRAQGIARAMVSFLLEEAVGRGYNEFLLHAQVYLEEFYKGFGFHRKGAIFNECGIDHVLMVRPNG
jgi:predicted GNAT family N-acyltransferase